MRTIPAAAMTLLLAIVAFATPLADAVTSLIAAADARVATIGTPVGKALKTETAQLAAASAALAEYGKSDLAGDVQALSRAAKALKSSKTKDAGVIGAVGGAAACLADVADQEITAAEQAAVNLYHPAVRTSIAITLTQARKAAAQAQAIAATDPVGALALLAKALAKGTAAAEAALDNANVGAPPADILWTRHSNSLLWITNTNVEPVIVVDVVFDADVGYSDGTRGRVRVALSKLVPGFADDGPARFVTQDETWSCQAEKFRDYVKSRAAKRGLTVSEFAAVAALRFKGRAGFFLPFFYNRVS
jgi:hypothetical protein